MTAPTAERIRDIRAEHYGHRCDCDCVSDLKAALDHVAVYARAIKEYSNDAFAIEQAVKLLDYIEKPAE